MTKKRDMRYARNRSLAKYDEDGPPPLYNNKLFRKAAGYTPDFRSLAADVGLSVNTVRTVFEGTAVKLDPIFILARWFKIDILQIFDVDHRLKFEDGKLIGLTTETAADRPTSKKASLPVKTVDKMPKGKVSISRPLLRQNARGIMAKATQKAADKLAKDIQKEKFK